LGEQGILSLLVEGGSEVNATMLNGNFIQKVITFIAPKILGGKHAPNAIGGVSPAKMNDAKTLKRVSWKQFGEDLCMTGYLLS
jgi:diaminohydroxyphosphoribosylaminopyrimidine deaminase/5-amino-6-(5-phosphoribosylamino)uracil reductase